MAHYHVRAEKRLLVSSLRDLCFSPLYANFRLFERTPGSWWIECPNEMFQLIEEEGAVVRVDGEYLPSIALMEFLRAAVATNEFRLTYDRRFPDEFVERCLIWKKMQEMQRTAVKGLVVKAQVDMSRVAQVVDYAHWSRHLQELLSHGYLEIVMQEEPNPSPQNTRVFSPRL